jgi:hypothetical protein
MGSGKKTFPILFVLPGGHASAGMMGEVFHSLPWPAAVGHGSY